MKLNIYQFSWNKGEQKDWVIASNKKEAKEIYLCETGMYKDELNGCDITYLKKKDWETHNYWEDERDNSITFDEYMKTASTSHFFCSTEY